MKKILIAVFAAVSAVSAAGAMDNGVNFGGAAVPLPKLERVQSAEEAQRALAGSAIPQRAAFSGAEETGALGRLLRQAGKKKSVPGGPVLECEFVGEAPSGSELCQIECCLMDNDGDGQPDGTDCHITPFCSPRPERAKSGAARVKALRFAAMLKELRNDKTTRGKYEDCVNGCIDSWLSCTGDSCGKTYDKCINACDKVVDTSK